MFFVYPWFFSEILLSAQPSERHERSCQGLHRRYANVSITPMQLWTDWQ
jgi:hypothetical protein